MEGLGFTEAPSLTLAKVTLELHLFTCHSYDLTTNRLPGHPRTPRSSPRHYGHAQSPVLGVALPPAQGQWQLCAPTAGLSG